MWYLTTITAQIDSTTIFPAFPQHLHTVLFTITLTSILTLLFIYASFTQCDIFSQLLHNWLCNNVYSISATYTYGTVYNYTTQYTGFAVYICFPFHNIDIFPQLLHNWLCNNVSSISSTYTYSTVYNYSPQYTGFAVYICFLFTMWIFSTHYCTIVYITTFTLNLQCNILYCIQLLLPVD